MRKFLGLALLLMLTTAGFTQSKKGELGPLRLSSSSFKAGISDGDSLLLIAFSQDNKRHYHSFTADGIKRWTATHRSKRLVKDQLLGTLQNDNDFLLFSAPQEKENELEVVRVNKHENDLKVEELDLAKGKTRILTSIQVRDRLVVIVHNRKSKEIGAILAQSSGDVSYLPLTYTEKDMALFLKGDFVTVNEQEPLGFKSLIQTKKAYPLTPDEFLLVADPFGRNDQGSIRVFNLDLESRTLKMRTIRNEETLISGVVRTYYHDKVLYRFINTDSRLSLTLYNQYGGFIRKYAYGADDDFQLANSRVYRSGGVGILGFDRIDGELKKTRKILRFTAQGLPFIKVETRKDSLIELTIGAYQYNTEDEVLKDHVTWETIDGMPVMGFDPFMGTVVGTIDKTQITSFKTILSPEYELTKQTTEMSEPQDLLKRFIDRQKGELGLVMTFPHTPYHRYLILENEKEGVSVLYTIRKEYFKNFK